MTIARFLPVRNYLFRMKLPFYSDCVSWPEDQMAVLHWLIDNGEPISYEEFYPHVDLSGHAAICQYWNYDEEELDELLTWNPEQIDSSMLDTHVRFYTCGGVYYYKHSAIEHVFATPEQIEQKSRELLDAESDDYSESVRQFLRLF